MNIEIRNCDMERAVWEAIVFFDLFDYPLRSKEIHRYCFLECGLDLVEKELVLMQKKGIIEEREGFYFLSGKENLIKIREERVQYSRRKFRKARLVAFIFRFIPWIKMIAIGNIIGKNNLRDESDIDFFVVTKKNRIWLTRFFCNSFTKLLGLRPKEGDMRDKICLSFFISDESVDLEKLMLRGEKDIYFIYWMADLKLIYNKKNTWDNFFKANSWIFNYLPNLRLEKTALKEYSFAWYRFNFKKAIKITFDRLEVLAGKFQLRILPRIIRDNMNKNTKVVVSRSVLKMHINDRREEYMDKFKSRCNSC